MMICPTTGNMYRKFPVDFENLLKEGWKFLAKDMQHLNKGKTL